MVVGVIDLNFIVFGRGLNLVVVGFILCFVVNWVVVKLVLRVILIGFVVVLRVDDFVEIFLVVVEGGVFDVSMVLGGVLEVVLVWVLDVDWVIIVWILVGDEVIDVIVL